MPRRIFELSHRTFGEADIRKRYGVRCFGRTDQVEEEFFAISIERRIKHPCVVALSATAKTALFA